MTGNRLDSIRAELESELEIAEAEAGRLKLELVAADKDVKAIKDALTALGRKPGQAPKKPALKKAEVIKVMTAFLKPADKPVSRDDLEVAIREWASKNDKSGAGITLRINEALKDAAFVNSEQGISLSAEQVAKSPA